MAYLRKTKQDTTTPEAPQSSLLSGGGALGSAGVPATGAAANVQDTKPAERTASTPSYVSGQQYLEGNRAGAQKLAQQIVDPIKRQASDIEAAARRKGLATIGAAGGGTTNEDLMSRATADARQLSAEEQAQVKQTLSGFYGGPTGVDFGAETTQAAGLGEATERLGTVAGLEQELGRRGGAGDRKYTGGMRAFDAMLMRQDPTLRTQLEAQAGLGERVGGTIAEQKAAALEAIASGQSGAAARGVTATKRLQDVATGQEGQWGTDLAALRGRTAGLNQAIRGEQVLNAEQLKMLGLSAQEYDTFRDAWIPTSYRLSRPQTKDEYNQYSYADKANLSSPGLYKADYWKQFQLDPYTINEADIGYKNVVGGEDLARYQALNQLRGAQGAGFVPGAALDDPLANATFFNKAGAMGARDAWLASGTRAPTSNYEYSTGLYGADVVKAAEAANRDWRIYDRNFAMKYSPQTAAGDYSREGGVKFDPTTGQMLSDWTTNFGDSSSAAKWDPRNTTYQDMTNAAFAAENARRSGGAGPRAIPAGVTRAGAAPLPVTKTEQQAANVANLGKTVTSGTKEGGTVKSKVMATPRRPTQTQQQKNMAMANDALRQALSSISGRFGWGR